MRSLSVHVYRYKLSFVIMILNCFCSKYRRAFIDLTHKPFPGLTAGLAAEKGAYRHCGKVQYIEKGMFRARSRDITMQQ
jgi:hypothetical protein